MTPTIQQMIRRTAKPGKRTKTKINTTTKTMTVKDMWTDPGKRGLKRKQFMPIESTRKSSRMCTCTCTCGASSPETPAAACLHDQDIVMQYLDHQTKSEDTIMASQPTTEADIEMSTQPSSAEEDTDITMLTQDTDSEMYSQPDYNEDTDTTMTSQPTENTEDEDTDNTMVSQDADIEMASQTDTNTTTIDNQTGACKDTTMISQEYSKVKDVSDQNPTDFQGLTFMKWRETSSISSKFKLKAKTPPKNSPDKIFKIPNMFIKYRKSNVF